MKLPLSLFLAITSLTSTTKLSTNLNVGIVLCHENIFCGKSEFLTAEMIDSSVDTTLTCVDWPGLFRAQDAEVWVTEGPDLAQLCSDWWPRLFNVPQRGDCLKGVLSHKFLPASKTLHKAGTIR